LLLQGELCCFNPLIKGTPAALFFIAVMVSSWVGGLGAGLLATVLSTLSLSYFLLEPRNSLKTAELQKILVVNDESDMRDLITSILEEHPARFWSNGSLMF
jgi:hypothetical protein